MTIIKNRNPIETAFNMWIANSPGSYHWCDMKRFYELVKTVCRYSRKEKTGAWLIDKINKCEKHNLQEEDLEYYSNLFNKLLEFYKTPCPPYIRIE